MKVQFKLFPALLAVAAAGVVAFIAGCASPPAVAQPRPLPPLAPPPLPPIVSAEPVEATMSDLTYASKATNPRDYRVDAASHLYGQNGHRIYKGKMPPLLYAVGVLQVEVDARGQVAALNWMRAPSHVPEVVAEIERTVRQAAPFPVPARMGRVTYTDTWLWHKSGHFQLDTLTEGQL